MTASSDCRATPASGKPSHCLITCERPRIDAIQPGQLADKIGEAFGGNPHTNSQPPTTDMPGN